MSFSDLGLSDELLKVIDDINYKEPSPIQKKAIPTILMGKDIVGIAQTGTGKTASFTLPMIDILSHGESKSRMPRSLILAPTRELAAQVSASFEKYGKYKSLSKALLVGGESMNDQIKLLDKGVDVLIATPGRLLDLFSRGMVLLSGIKVLVIDEADRMLDMGFIPDIEKIISLLSFNRQTLLFSATMPDEVKKLSEKFLDNPKHISVAPPATTSENVEQTILWVYENDKFEVLETLLSEDDFINGFVFCNRKKDVDKVSMFLEKKKFKVKGWHGDMPQAARNEALRMFKDGEVDVLVCSDVAARGIDIQNVSYVFNFDVPMNSDDYVHRIGRTGRAGAKGYAWMIATLNEAKSVKQIEKLIGSKIEVAEIEGIESPSDSEVEEAAKHDGNKRYKKSYNPNNKKINNKKHNNHTDNKNQAKPKQKNENRHQNNKDVVGFGDELPAFMSNVLD